MPLSDVSRSVSAIAAALGGIAVLAAAVGLAVRRHRALAEGRRAWRAAHPVAADGIIPGAGSLVLNGTDARAALLLHGFGDTPQSLARQAHALHARGWTVVAPLLPGHGRTLEDFQRSNAAQWAACAREAYDTLAQSHASVAVVGLSMGGALAVRVVAEAARGPSALVLIVPYLDLSARARAWTTLWPIWSLWRAWVPGNPVASIHDPVARRESLGYGSATPRLLRELRRVVERATAVANRVTTPTLAIFSTADYRVSPEGARRAFAAIGAAEKAIHWVTRSGHVVTVDYDADEVSNRLIDWLERHSSPATR